MTRRIREDFEGVVYVAGDALKAGDEEPEGVTLGDHLFAESPGSGDPGYDGMKVEELKAEIARRNEGRADADLIPAEGLKADLVAALQADDSK